MALLLSSLKNIVNREVWRWVSEGEKVCMKKSGKCLLGLLQGAAAALILFVYKIAGWIWWYERCV